MSVFTEQDKLYAHSLGVSTESPEDTMERFEGYTAEVLRHELTDAQCTIKVLGAMWRDEQSRASGWRTWCYAAVGGIALLALWIWCR